VQQHRTPKRKREMDVEFAATFWSAAVFRRFVTRELSDNKIAPAIKRRSELLKSLVAPRLTDPGAQEAPVVLQPHLAAGKKVRNRCDRFPAAVRAGTDRQDEITQRKPCARL